MVGFHEGNNGAELPFTHVERIGGREYDLIYFRNEGGALDCLHAQFLDELDAEGLLRY